MASKDTLFGWLLVVLIIYTISKSQEFLSWHNYLRETSPECVQSNPYALFVYVGAYLFLIPFCYLLNKSCLYLCGKFITTYLKSLSTLQIEEKTEIMGDHLNSLVKHTIMSFCWIYILKDCSYLHTSLFGKSETVHYWTNYPC
jgi:hypothetical protein